MFVQALAEYADTQLAKQLNEFAFETKPVPYFLELSAKGEFLSAHERMEQIPRGKKMVQQAGLFLIPKSPVNRNSGLHPLLACDDVKYVLGSGAWTAEGQQQNNEQRHAAFVLMLRQAAEATGDAGLIGCVRFYERPDQVEAAKAALALRKVAAGAYIALSVDGAVVAREAVQQFWRDHYLKQFGERNSKGGEGICLISGKYGPIAPTHDKIKGAASLGGQSSGVALMSFDKDAFTSYGWEKNANSPVSPDRAAAYVLALNELMKPSSRCRRDHAGIGFIFWTKRPTSDDPIALLEDAQPEEVQKLLQLQDISLEPNDFYFLGLSGNGGRLLVRQWLHESLSTVKANLRGWFEGLRMANAFSGSVGDPPKFWQVLKAIARDEPPASRVLQLLRRAIQGQPLGKTILAAALARLRVAHGNDRLDAVRMGVIRLSVNDLEGSVMSDSLDTGQSHPAYLCGRLLTIYDGLQWQAQGDLNVTTADRYYALASTNPTVAFPRIETLGQSHLKKLRRDNRGAMVAIEREIQDLHRLLATKCNARFPSSLSLEDQGRFAIGFHHQRADNMARAKARKNEKEQQENSNE